MLSDGANRIGQATAAVTGWVIEVAIDGRIAWLVQPIPGERYTFAFELEQAHVFPAFGKARDHGSSVQCGYFDGREGSVAIIPMTDEYRALNAADARPKEISMSKADYVRLQPVAAGERHTCHWPGCTNVVKPAVWGCRPHWFMLPPILRQAIWNTYRAGQEIDKRPSEDYLRVAQEVQDWIRDQARQRAEKNNGVEDKRTLDLF